MNLKIDKQLKNSSKVTRYPNLGTVLMVEEFLQKNQSTPLKISEIKKGIPKKVMHQTLKVILEYLWKSGKIIYGPRGIQWIYTSSKEMDKLIGNSIEF